MMNKNSQLSSRFKQVFHNTGFGIMVVDKDRNLIEVNPKFCEMLGYKRDELIGKSAKLIHISVKTYKEFGEKAFNQVRNKKPVNLDWPFKKKNKQRIWFHIAGDPVADKDEVLWTVVDITQRIKAQNKIEQLVRDTNNSIKIYISSVAIEATRNILLQNLSKDKKSDLIEESITELNSVLKS